LISFQKFEVGFSPKNVQIPASAAGDEKNFLCFRKQKTEQKQCCALKLNKNTN
tara:strand:- start:291 stop:449 length:159 start_codon:yes stop_codon:yes gene_type:complete